MTDVRFEVVDGEIVSGPLAMPRDWKSVISPEPTLVAQAEQFAATRDAELKAIGRLPQVEIITPEYDPATQVLEGQTHALNATKDGVISTWIVRDKTIDELNAPILAQIRAIEATDGYSRALRDAPIDATAAQNLSDYRDAIAALRAQLV